MDLNGIEIINEHQFQMNACYKQALFIHKLKVYKYSNVEIHLCD